MPRVAGADIALVWVGVEVVEPVGSGQRCPAAVPGSAADAGNSVRIEVSVEW
jgi:hypothetical protein